MIKIFYITTVVYACNSELILNIKKTYWECDVKYIEIPVNIFKISNECIICYEKYCEKCTSIKKNHSNLCSTQYCILINNQRNNCK